MKTEVIYVDKKFRKALEADFGVSQSTVSLALNFKHFSKLQSEIRSKAMNSYNGLYLKC